MITPVNPSSPRSRPLRAAADSVAGASPVSSGTRRWPGITPRTPAAMAAANGGRSRRRSRSRLACTVTMPWWESALVLPCPGKCFAHAATPAACRPRTAAAACRATRSGSAPNDRMPMTGLSAAVFTSTDGARFTLMPRAARSWPSARCTAAVRITSSTAPSAALPG